MADGGDFEDDLFADVYAEDIPAAPPPKASAPAPIVPVQDFSTSNVEPVQSQDAQSTTAISSYENVQSGYGDYGNDSSAAYDQYNGHDGNENDDGYGPIGIKEDGKMFIGGLNWETTDESLRDYFSQFGEVTECTVMRDGASGRSRGFGFLTFKDPKVVNTVMVKEHFLDGKIIDPKRAIPREEQERTAKIFVGGVSPEASEADFKNFFMQFGRVIDATLMMDKDTGRPRGFGFVTFDGEEAVDRALSRPLEIYGKPMEVKRAQPRSTLQQQNEEKKFGRQNDRFGRQNESQGFDQQNPMQAAGMGGAQSGISPAMMAKYWFNMQQYFKQMQTMMTQNVPGQMGMPNPMAGGQMNPAMMAGMMGMGGPGNGSPNSQMMQQGGPPSGMMSPNAMQQMAQQQQQQQQRQQQQAQQQQAQQQPQGGGNDGGAVESQFDRDQYERQRMQGQQYAAQQANYGQGGPTSWDGMYDDTPQPNVPPQGPAQRGGGGYGRGNFTRGARQMNTPPTQPVANAPPNAPTGPKNAGRPGANYRGGGRGSQRGYHPYAR